MKHAFDINRTYLPEWIRLDQSENPYGFSFNRYPSKDNEQKLYEAYIQYINRDLNLNSHLSADNLLFTRGAADAIDLILRTFARGADEKIVVSDPTFFPIKHWAKIYNIPLVAEKLTGDTLNNINVDNVISSKATICFLIHPNNPTSTCLDSTCLRNIIDNFNGLVVVDEAYIDFCHDRSIVELVHQKSNLIVLRSMSKAWGCAGLRAGFIIANDKLITSLQFIQPPFMCDSFTCDHLSFLLKERYTEFCNYRELIITSRDDFLCTFNGLDGFETLPSDTNFILIRCAKIPSLEKVLMSHNIVTKSLKINEVEYVRIGIGNQLEMKVLKQILIDEANCDPKY
ncbi:pyridoxal phosphate-dependent aminotransferase [Xenorhabdus bovienii]|uniref:pyridoxal phosphate-dependent aminotransferase n=1 Tax=Xenorhabdus bovienii TaxID=40576 RepID=UPI0023B00A16|nr:histidinol-phosphate transaminase [Xenorhabdus bovienii]MDE9432634.1 histidinol-phosphate aminotransferase family protein [Xenorhabdus bovienii]MDE9477693.1 histidinol-phosphate aminotransferase family protein [Xenorhabdus bovienii]MDE9490410.1 histidinol-phosphate aminotransferase family protein [Xenorhabdus bovienii]MDE9506686.1 histidinol-phosphate aminotransferase family protein [Xenorhabdus bovienii]MDE9547300.1 histidinol-phosphate aminotransferase family protein [Xenorhabdus bovienii